MLLTELVEKKPEYPITSGQKGLSGFNKPSAISYQLRELNKKGIPYLIRSAFLICNLTFNTSIFVLRLNVFST